MGQILYSSARMTKEVHRAIARLPHTMLIDNGVPFTSS